eukprot:2167215-Amphidinium_carterae.1
MSCRSQYDAYNLALVPAQLGMPWRILCFAPKDWHVTCNENPELGHVEVGGESLKGVVVREPAYRKFESLPQWRPYRRVLAERLKKTLLERQKVDD